MHYTFLLGEIWRNRESVQRGAEASKRVTYFKMINSFLKSLKNNLLYIDAPNLKIAGNPNRKRGLFRIGKGWAGPVPGVAQRCWVEDWV